MSGGYDSTALAVRAWGIIWINHMIDGHVDPSGRTLCHYSRTHVRYAEVVTERPRIALRQPRRLQPEQLGQLTVCTPAVPPRVRAWILWEDGVEELVPAQAIAWTKRAVRVRFGAPPHQHVV